VKLKQMVLLCVTAVVLQGCAVSVQRHALFDEVLTPNLIAAIAHAESRGNVRARSYKGARGLMQIMPHTASTVCGLTRNELWDKQKNLQCGMTYLRLMLTQECEGDLICALGAYYTGPKHKHSRQARTYATKILRLQKENYLHYIADMI
jgi:soluble lytic murein transglycosylase-like protein